MYNICATLLRVCFPCSNYYLFPSRRILSCKCQKVSPVSDAIFFHLHGGGFVAQTSKSHSNYLAKWSRDLGIPILSVDYSLAPEFPYPR